VTSYTTFSPLKKSDCGRDFEIARAQLVSDAVHLSRSTRPGFTDADRARFGEIADRIRAWTPVDACDLTVFDGWGSPRRFLIVAEFAL